MSKYQALIDALKAGPTGSSEDHQSIWMKVGNFVMLNSGRPVFARVAHCVYEPNAAYIAAANPATIRSLLADLERAEKALKGIDKLDPHKDSTTEWNAALHEVSAALSQIAGGGEQA